MRELSADEERRFWATLWPDYHPLLRFYLHKGLRKRACAGLTKNRFDLDGPAIVIRRKSKKGEARARQRLTASLAAVLQREMVLAPGDAVWSYIVQRGSTKDQRRLITVSGFEVVMNTTLKAAGF